ncbi:hypothetical protein Tco_0741679, partial [Tanacetum coccineum]
MGSHTMQQLKGYTFDELKELFETTMKHVSTFTPMDIEDKERASELAVGSSKRPAETKLNHESSKKQMTDEASSSEAYQTFANMLKKFNRDDLVKIWDLVKERFSTTEPTDDKEKELWVELKRLKRLSIVKRSSDVDVGEQA